jgi:hypothetical protein
MAVVPRTCDACGENLGEPGTSSYFRAEDGTIQMACSDCVIAGSVNALDDAWEFDERRGS